jgi:hypothetical protein
MELIPVRHEKGDDPMSYDSFEAVNPTTGKLERFLRHQPNGDCIYLGPSGCTIHGRQPATCKAFGLPDLFPLAQQAPGCAAPALIAVRPRIKKTAEVGTRMQAENRV